MCEWFRLGRLLLSWSIIYVLTSRPHPSSSLRCCTIENKKTQGCIVYHPHGELLGRATPSTQGVQKHNIWNLDQVLPRLYFKFWYCNLNPHLQTFKQDLSSPSICTVFFFLFFFSHLSLRHPFFPFPDQELKNQIKISVEKKNYPWLCCFQVTWSTYFSNYPSVYSFRCPSAWHSHFRRRVPLPQHFTRTSLFHRRITPSASCALSCSKRLPLLDFPISLFPPPFPLVPLSTTTSSRA